MTPKKKNERKLQTLLRPDDFHEEGSREDDEQLNEMTDELAEALGIEFDD
jgi:hypothetical protein